MKFTTKLLTTLIILVLIGSCKKKDDMPCGGVSINVTATATTSDGTNGIITASATGGSGFTFSNGGPYQASGTFTNVAPGIYTIWAKTAEGCIGFKDVTVNGTKTFFLTRLTWKFSSAFIGLVDISSSLQACQKDNILTFVAGGTGNLNEGATKCQPTDPTDSPFTWSFLSAETQLQISASLFTGGSGVFTIVSLTPAQMVLSQQIVISGIPQTVTVTFIH